jgi:tetratricopeptide (TPR) repeat protein
MRRRSGIPGAHPDRLVPATCILCSLLATPALAQRDIFATDPADDPHRMDIATTYRTNPGTAVLLINVLAEGTRVPLDRQAVVKLFSVTTQTAAWQTTEDQSLAALTNVVLGSYEIEVSAVGYLSLKKELQVTTQFGPTRVEIVLQRDPAAVSLEVAGAMPGKARKEAKRAVSALKSGKLQEAEKRLDLAYRLVPSSPDLNFLLGYLYFQKKDYAQAGNYLETATNLKPHDVQALTLLGRVGLEREDYSAARSALEQAVEADAENWLPRNLLADSYLRQRNYEKAREHAELAISKGKTKASPAQLVLGQALVGLGRDQDGIRALNTFLQDSPGNPVAPQVRSLIAEIAQRNSSPRPTDQAQVPSAVASLSAVDPLRALAAPDLSVKAWQPAGIDEVKPSLAAGVACPAAKVIDASGERVTQLVDDVSRIGAVEDLLHQSLDEMGNPIRTETRKFNYVASFEEPEPGFIAVGEYRGEGMNLRGFPDQIASTGFAALALVFHPHMRDAFEMICEGLGEWHGQAAWLVHFRQRADRPSRIHGYKLDDRVYPVSLKGRAWITADNFQIVRIEAELVNSMPEIRLLSEHQIVDYGPIPFPKKNMDLWLPKSAEIYFEFRKHRYYRRHSFDHYMLFSVDSNERRKEPPAKPADKPGSADGK